MSEAAANGAQARSRELTARQLEVLRLLQGRAPTLAEIGDELGVTRERIRQLLEVLGKRGLVERAPRRWRSARLTDAGEAKLARA
jgi:DNA-directed RNA polymerase sigma subunit (sigma70/sigma32)